MQCLSSGLYFAGRELATSNNQAWTALALSKIKSMARVETRTNRGVLRCIRGLPDNEGRTSWRELRRTFGADCRDHPRPYIWTF